MGAVVVDDNLILVYSMDFGALMAVEMITRNGCFVVMQVAGTERRSGWCGEPNHPTATTQGGM